MGEVIQVHWLSDIDQVEAEYYQALTSSTTIFNDEANGIHLLTNKFVAGSFSIYYKTSGGGTVDFEYFLSQNGAGIVDPSSSAGIIAGVVTGTESFTGFIPVLAPWIGIRAIEQGVGAVNFEKLALFYH